MIRRNETPARRSLPTAALVLACLVPPWAALAEDEEEKPDPGIRIIRLYHLREAPAIVKAFQPLAEDGVLLRAIGDDLIVLDGPHAPSSDPKQLRTNLKDLRTKIEMLDLPRPQITLRFFLTQMNEKSSSPEDGGALGQGQEVLRGEVAELNTRMQSALRQGVDYLEGLVADSEQRRNEPDAGGGGALDPGSLCRGAKDAERDAQRCRIHLFRDYLSKPVSAAMGPGGPGYALGYRDVFSGFPPSLSRLFVLLAATDESASNSMGLIAGLIRCMEDRTGKACNLPPSPPKCKETVESKRAAEPEEAAESEETDCTPEVFQRFAKLLGVLLDDEGDLRAAIADHLFHYKWSIQYPRDVISYDLRRSADHLDSLFGAAVEAFTADLEVYVARRLRLPPWELLGDWDGKPCPQECAQSAAKEQDAECRKREAERREKLRPMRRKLEKGLDYTSAGLVGVSTLSAESAKVEGQVQQYFGFQTPMSLGDALDAANEALNDDGGLLAAIENDPRVAAAKVGLAILERAADPDTRTIAIGAGTTVDVTPHALSAASSAELRVVLTTGEREPPTHVEENAPEPIDRIQRHSVEDTVRVESLKLFELSSFAYEQRLAGPGCPLPGLWTAVLSRPVRRCPFPLVGHVFELLVGWAPGGWGDTLMTPLSLAVGPKHKRSMSSAVIGALVVPTAADVALGIRFAFDRPPREDTDASGDDTRFGTLKELARALGKPPRGIHKCVLSAIREGPLRDDCP